MRDEREGQRGRPWIRGRQWIRGRGLAAACLCLGALGLLVPAASGDEAGPRLTEEKLLPLLAEAASVPSDELAGAVRLRSLKPPAGAPLTTVCAFWPRFTADFLRAGEDFRLLASGPQQIPAFLEGAHPSDVRQGRPVPRHDRASVLHPEYVARLAIWQTGREAGGHVTFICPGAFDGSLRWGASWRDGRWRVDRFEFPASGWVLRLQAERWQLDRVEDPFGLGTEAEPPADPEASEEAGTQPAGGPPGRDAVHHALHWLRAHQSPSGAWEAAGFDAWCDGRPADPEARPDGLGKPPYDVGVTGLALTAFLGAGYTNRGDHAFKQTITDGLRYLKRVQDAEGCFGPRTSQHYIYNHAMAALAMVEAYGMTGSPIFKGSAQRALDFIGLARNPYFTWRYGVKPGENDTSVTTAMTLPLIAAREINRDAEAPGREPPLVYDTMAFDGVLSWLEKMTDEHGRVGYISRGSGPARPKEMLDRFPAGRSASMTAAGNLLRSYLLDDPKSDPDVVRGAQHVKDLPPVWNLQTGDVDMYYWRYGTLLMYRFGGEHWRTWSRALETAVVGSQRLDSDPCGYKGSWDPIGPWGPDGGRVYSTAMMTLCLELWYRYENVWRGPR